jgi:hypothetical protein
MSNVKVKVNPTLDEAQDDLDRRHEKMTRDKHRFQHACIIAVTIFFMMKPVPEYIIQILFIVSSIVTVGYIVKNLTYTKMRLSQCVSNLKNAQGM